MGILIIDASAEVCERLKSTLAVVGYQEVWTATSAEHALELLGIPSKGGPVLELDVILLDLNLAGGGAGLCRQIKSQERLCDVPVIIMAGSAEEVDLETAFTAGAVDFIQKPIKVLELLVRLRAAMALKRELDARKERERELLLVTRKLQEVNQILQRISTQDGLTGLANRRYLDLFLAKEWSRCMRDQSSLALILIDIDHFKAFNDRYGHPAGDECLRRVAGVLSAVLKRPGDLAARYGGEEFLLILPRTDAAGARAIAEMVRNRVQELAIPHAGSSWGVVTVSQGVASMPPPRGSSAGLLLHLADQALYRAKGSGRNQVVVHDQDRTWIHDLANNLPEPHALEVPQPVQPLAENR